jgi:hypothetical protein
MGLLHKLVSDGPCRLYHHNQSDLSRYQVQGRWRHFFSAKYGAAVFQVAHAWLQDETSSAGSPKEDNLVCKAIRVVSTCADSLQKSVHLGIIQALLTIATSEHFVPHGEALVQCLKLVFNMAIATDDDLTSLTAQNALLQVHAALPHV